MVTLAADLYPAFPSTYIGNVYAYELAYNIIYLSYIPAKRPPLSYKLLLAATILKSYCPYPAFAWPAVKYIYALP